MMSLEPDVTHTPIAYYEVGLGTQGGPENQLNMDWNGAPVGWSKPRKPIFKAIYNFISNW